MFRPVAKCSLHLMNSQIDRETAQTVQFACIVFSTRRRECYSYDLLNRKKPNQLNSGDRDGYRTWSSFAFQLKQSVWAGGGGGWLLLFSPSDVISHSEGMRPAYAAYVRNAI